MGTRILIIGSGGREHALAYSIVQSPKVGEVLVVLGNAGTEMEKKCRNITLNRSSFGELADIVEIEDVNQIIVGPEKPLVKGIVDFFYIRGFFKIFGPTLDASAIESDKFFSYEVMNGLRIPQAESILCYTEDEAIEAINKMSSIKGVVIKARGLTAGKGVYVCGNKDEALFRLKKHTNLYGPQVLIAERLFGEEFSVFGISDGERVVPLEISVQDHKPLLNGDKGPNTGGMGAYCPAPIADSNLVNLVSNTMMAPLVQIMKKDGREFKGFLYAAVMMTENGPKILEYNCRFGDPEAQPGVMMLEDGLYEPISVALEGRLDEINFKFKPGAACCVVMASDGYPGKYEKGFPIGGLEDVAELNDVKIFHASTKSDEKGIVTNGGRVLGVTAYSKDGIRDAQERAYEAVSIIDKSTKELNGGKEVFVYRRDIGAKALG
ncbi:MAG: phosphoribosylamine--glycine ligase [Nanoarchaeota archaeon]|nr:phosphoribosylamine--glycine ligase [Nanoarchaeota archaeon]